MPTNFKPLRRKIGVVTLVMTCVLMCAWVTSIYRTDFIDSRVFFATTNGIAIQNDQQSFLLGISHEETPPDDPNAPPPPPPVVTTVTNPDGSRTTMTEYAGVTTVVINVIVELPYWSVVIPLTLLSAWLLLSKPPQKRAAPKPIP